VPEHGGAGESRLLDDQCNAQFLHVTAEVRGFLGRGCPVISVDTKRKGFGAFKNPWRIRRKLEHPERVHIHDFPHLGHRTAIP